MAVGKAKKSKQKFKVGKFKSTNKWLIVGGVAAVVIIGIVVVRYSSAAVYTKWVSVARNTSVPTLTTTPLSLGLGDARYMTILSGNTYRTCVRAYATGRTKSKFTMTDVNGSTFNYYVGREDLFCTNPARASRTRSASTWLRKISGANVIIKAASIDQLVYLAK